MSKPKAGHVPEPSDSMDNAPDDSELMMNYVIGNEEAFATLFGRYSQKLSTFIYFRLGSKKRHLSEEIFQKTWMKIHLARKLYDPSRKFSAWFYTIALNTLRDEVGSLYERSRHDEITQQVADHAPTSEERYIAKEQFQQIEGLFRYLSESQKTALILSDQEGLSSKEISEIMEISDSSARQLVSRARKIIRTNYKEGGSL